MQCGAAAPAAWARRCARVGLLALAGALLGGCALLPASLGGPPSADANADTIATSRRPARPEFVLAVEAPDALRDMLLRNLDLARLQQLPDDARLGSTEFNRLVAAVPAQARTLLQTEGYFDAQVDVQRMSERVPDGRSTAVPGVVRVVVAPGPPTRVQALQLQIEGALQQQIDAGDAEAIALQQALRAAGVLSAGQVFRNADWAGSKQQLLVRLRSAGYATAALAYSNAEVDADAQAATLSVTLDSGPLFRAGPVQITGLKAHDADTVQALAGFGPGAALTETLLLAYQDRLQKTRLFNNVSVSFEPDAGNAAAAPVQVRVTEALLQQATVGAGISANTGPRVTLEHTHRRPFDLPAVVYNKLEWGRDIQSWNGDLQSHPRAGFYRNIFGVQIDRAVSNTDVVLSQRLRLGRSQDTPRIERLYFVELLHSRQADLPGATTTRITSPSSATALSANAHWTWRDLDNQLLPTRGLSVLLQGGAGQALQRGGPNGAFARLYGRVTGYLPLGDWYGSARIELGQVVHGAGVHVPDALGFRAGGDDSVRGYGYRALAPVDANGSTISGERLFTASVEVARPIMASLPTVWGALFIDAGRAVADWRDFKPAFGYGAGVRWRSPIGPLRMDLAWADELKKFRLHLSVGIAF